MSCLYGLFHALRSDLLQTIHKIAWACVLLILAVVPALGRGAQAQTANFSGTTITLPSGFSDPQGVAVDGNGNVFVADSLNKVVKEIVAGTGGAASGTVNGSSTVIPLGTGFNDPQGVAVDGSGNVFVADTGNSAVKEILAGTGGAANGTVNGTSTVNTLRSGLSIPSGVAVDANGNVFVANKLNNAVLEIVAGTGGAASGTVNGSSTVNTLGSGFSNPHGVAVDGSGDVFVGDTGNNAVKEILAANGTIPSNPTIITLGSGFNGPTGVAVDSSGNVFVADTGDSAVKEIDMSGVNFGSVAIAATMPPTQTLQFTFTAAGTIGAPAVLTQGAARKDFKDAGGTCTANGTFAVGDSCTVVVSFTPAHPGPRYGAVELLNTAGTAVVASANVFGIGTGPQITFSPGLQSTLGSGFSLPSGVAVDGSGNVFVADSVNSAVKEIVAVNGSIPASNPTINTLGSGFNDPFGVAVDGSGNVFVADSGNSAVKEILAVNGSIPASNPTINTLGSGFSEPSGVAVDGSGNVFVADSGNNAVKEINVTNPTLTFATATDDGTTDTTDGVLSVTITNDGNEPLTAISPGLSLAANFLQIVGNGTPPDCTASFSLAEDASCNLSFEFAPGGLLPSGTVNGSVTLTDNSLNATPSTMQQIQLVGTTVMAPTAVTSVLPGHGPLVGGTSVTITGIGFTGASAVLFGSTPASSFTVDSATQITATAPSATGTGTNTINVTVTSPAGTSPIIADDQFTYTDQGAAPPTITGITPSGGPLGTVVTITGTGFVLVTNVFFGSTPASGFTVNSANQITATAPAPSGTGTVNVTVTTTVGGTSNSVPFDLTSEALVVTTLADSGPGSLRNALGAASSGDTIFFAVTGTITLTSGTLNVPVSVNIQGPGASNLTISGANQFTVFTAGTSGTGASISISGLTIANGNGTVGGILGGPGSTPDKAFFIIGGNGASGGAVTVSNSTFSNNTSTAGAVIKGGSGGNGGGGAAGDFTGGNGGNGASGGAVTVSNSTFSGNTSTAGIVAGGDGGDGGGGGQGGVMLPGGPGGSGGNGGSGGAVTVSNSTFSGNTSTAGIVAGGGGSNGGGGGSGGAALGVPDTGSGGTGGFGGSGGAVTVSNSIFSGNTSTADFAGGSGGGSSPGGPGNIFGGGAGGASSPGGPGVVTATNNVDANSMLAPLGNYGGTTQTMLPQPGSAAICAGSKSLAVDGNGNPLTTDQRGFPMGASNSSYCPAGSVDAGAVQTNYQSVQFTNVPSGGAYTALPNQLPSPAPNVSVTESGQNIGGVPVTLADSSATVSGLGPVPTSTGMGATFSVEDSATEDTTLSATLQITPGFSLTTSPTAAFDVSTSPTVTGISPTSGPAAGGTTATITGTNFTGATGVSFGGAAATKLTLVSATTITATSPAGTGTVDVVVTTPGGTSATSVADRFTYLLPLTLSPATLPAATVGTAYSQTITASGGSGTATFAIGTGALPAGLRLNATTGVLSGTPTASGSFNFTVTATASGGGTASQPYTLTVNAAATITITPATLPGATVGAAYSEDLTASGGTAPYTFAISAGALPAGIALSGGVLAGAPAASGNFNFTVTATGSGGTTGSQIYTLLVNAAAGSTPTITISPATLAAATAGTAYSATLTASGGTAPYTFALLSGTLPGGITLSPGGVLAGTLADGGTFNFTVKATDSSAAPGPYSGTASYTLLVNAAAGTTSAAGFTFTTTGASAFTAAPGAVATYSFGLSPLSGSYAGPVSFTVTGLPAGAMASFTPSSVAAGGGAQTVTMSVQTAAAVAHSNGYPLGRGVVLALLLLPFVSKRSVREKLKGRLLLMALLLVGMTVAMSGCGSTNGFTLQSPQTYTLTVTATSGSVQHSQTTTLIVQ